MITRLFLSAASLAAAVSTLIALPGDLHAMEPKAKAAANRIVLASQQKMFGESMGEYFCFLQSGVDESHMADKLAAISEVFGQVHQGFVNGDAEFDLSGETDAKVIAEWESVQATWQELQPYYTRAVAGAETNEAEFGRAIALGDEMRERINSLVAQFRSSYAADLGEGGIGRAILLDLYSRQRMLSQKMAKEVCLSYHGYRPAETETALRATFEMFETALDAFIDGMPEVGIPAAETPQIREHLIRAREIWSPIRAVVLDIADKKNVSTEALATFSDGVDEFVVEMNKAIELLPAVRGVLG